MTSGPEILLADADVLIDYRDADLGVLRLVGEHIGPLKVLTLVREQVAGLSVRMCSGLGVEVVEPDVASPLAAVPWQERVATALARRWTLVTNDRVLGRLAQEQGVTGRRGLGLMVELVRSGAMARHRALRVAHVMQAHNPIHLNERVMRRFAQELDGA